MLLKNDGVLPLSRKTRRIAVVGPTADDTMALLGNYYGTPAAPVTILQGIREAAPNAQVVHARGVDLVEGRDDPAATPLIEPQYLRPENGSTERGLRGEYFRSRDLSGKPALVRVDSQIGFRWDRGSPTDNLMARGEAHGGQSVPPDNFSIRWSGQLLPPVSGTYQLEAAANDGFRLYLDGKLLLDQLEGQRPPARRQRQRDAAGRSQLRPAARVLRRRARRRRAPGMAHARREAAVRGSAAGGARVRRGDLRRRPHRRRRRRGDDGELSRASPAATAPTCACPRPSRSCLKPCRRPASRWCWC